MCEVALVIYGSTAASDALAIGTGPAGAGATRAQAFDAPYGLTIVGSYALVARAPHARSYGTTPASSSPRSP